VLRWMPVTQNMETGQTAPEDGDSPIKAVLRSKGFMWMSHNHMTAFYWSHAGQHFEIRDEGDWCAAEHSGSRAPVLIPMSLDVT
jgi:G3E family GTPase